jgi:hypothetical protein
MPRVSGWLRVHSRDRFGRPVDPGFGVDEGDLEESGEYPDQGGPSPGRPGHLPSWGRPPGRPGQGLPRPPRPTDPDYGIDEGEYPDQGLPGGGHFWPDRPSQGLPRPPRPPHVWPRPPSGGLPVDPGWGGGGRPERPERPEHGLPIFPSIPGKPDNSLPPVDGEEPPPVDPPPGTIWPPLPPTIPPGKVIALVAISGVGYRYAVLTVPPPKPGQGLPPQRPPVPQPKT